MDVKILEIRDVATTIFVMATALFYRDESERYALRHAGFGREQIVGPVTGVEPYVIVTKLHDADSRYDAFRWDNRRTMTTAHRYIIEHWTDLKSGDVVDVEFILGESKSPKVSERLTAPII